jgi:hypothetical protein
VKVKDWRVEFLRILPMSSSRLTTEQINILASELANTLHNNLKVDIVFGDNLDVD